MTYIHLVIDPEIKKKATLGAVKRGLTLSSVARALITRFALTDELDLQTPEIPNAKTIREIKQAEKELAEGKGLFFKNGDEALKYFKEELKKEIREEKSVGQQPVAEA